MVMVIFDPEGRPIAMIHNTTGQFKLSDFKAVSEFLVPENYYVLIRGSEKFAPGSFLYQYMENVSSYLDLVGIPKENIYIHQSDYYNNLPDGQGVTGIRISVSLEEGIEVFYVDTDKSPMTILGSETIRRGSGLSAAEDNGENTRLEKEKRKSTYFSDTAIIIQEEHSLEPVKDPGALEEPVILALGTSWIEGYKRDRGLQYSALNPLVTSLRDFCGERGIIFLDREDADLLAAIEEAGGRKQGAKVIVLAGEDTVKSGEFAFFREKEGSFLAGVDGTNLTEDSYMYLVEMLTLALRLAYGKHIDWEDEKISVKEKDGYYIFVPAAEPVDYELLKRIYNIQRFA